MLCNPFGPREGFDVPHKSVGLGIRRLARQLARGQLPATILASDAATDSSFMEETDGAGTSRNMNLTESVNASGGGSTLLKSLFHSSERRNSLWLEQ